MKIRKKHPLNLTVADETKQCAEQLAQDSGDSSISSLFDRLVADEWEREKAEVDNSTWAVPAAWKAMLATVPQAEQAFLALACSSRARDAFHSAVTERNRRGGSSGGAKTR